MSDRIDEPGTVCLRTRIGWAHVRPHRGCPSDELRNLVVHINDCDICARAGGPVCATAITELIAPWKDSDHDVHADLEATLKSGYDRITNPLLRQAMQRLYPTLKETP